MNDFRKVPVLVRSVFSLSSITFCTALLVFSLSACVDETATPSVTTLVPITPQLTPEPELDLPQIDIDGVEVREGELIGFSGTTTLPGGECLNSELTQDGMPVEWWPVDQCFEISAQEWRISVALGTEDRPENLDGDTQYQLRVWWPSAPETVLDVFYFDLSAPPSP